MKPNVRKKRPANDSDPCLLGERCGVSTVAKADPIGEGRNFTDSTFITFTLRRAENVRIGAGDVQLA